MNTKKTHDRDTPRPSFYELIRQKNLCSSLLFVNVCLSVASCFVHVTQHIALMAYLTKENESHKSTSVAILAQATFCPSVPLESKFL